MTEDSLVNLGVQWHITTLCNNRCKHCYMFDSKTYEKEKKEELSLNELIQILDSFEDFEKKYNANIGHFSISGGDPLLRKDWPDFFAELKVRKKEISIMANPENITKENVSKLKKYEVNSLQMSLDGLEKTHDYFRSKGSFQRTIKAAEFLVDNGIRTNIMFTLFPTNANELIPLMEFLAKNSKVSSFSFDIGCFVGNANELVKNFKNHQLQEILKDFLLTKKRLKEEGYLLHCSEKSNLLKVSKFELEENHPLGLECDSVYSGCLIGWTPCSILSNGVNLACRRMPIETGKMPEQSFEEIFLGSEILRKFRRPEFFEGCGSCDFYAHCRGCPANVYGLTGDPFAKNPLCFRENISKSKNFIRKSPPLDISYQDEWEFIKKRHLLRHNILNFLDNEHFQDLYVDLHNSENNKKNFLKDPEKFVDSKKFKISKEELVWILYKLSGQYPNETVKVNGKDEDLFLDQIKIRKIEKQFT